MILMVHWITLKFKNEFHIMEARKVWKQCGDCHKNDEALTYVQTDGNPR